MVDIFYGHGFLEPHPLPVHGHSSPTNAISSLISLNEILLRLMHSLKFSLLSAIDDGRVLRTYHCCARNSFGYRRWGWRKFDKWNVFILKYELKLKKRDWNLYILYIYSRFLVKYNYFETHEINLTNERNSNLVEISCQNIYI